MVDYTFKEDFFSIFLLVLSIIAFLSGWNDVVEALPWPIFQQSSRKTSHKKFVHLSVWMLTGQSNLVIHLLTEARASVCSCWFSTPTECEKTTRECEKVQFVLNFHGVPSTGDQKGKVFFHKFHNRKLSDSRGKLVKLEKLRFLRLNLDRSALVELVCEWDDTWKAEFSLFVFSETGKIALAWILVNRHQMVHNNRKLTLERYGSLGRFEVFTQDVLGEKYGVRTKLKI